VGGHEVLWELETIAPVHPVYGNTDDPFDPHLRQHVQMDIGGISIHVSHGHELGAPTTEKLLARYSADVLVFGHTHKALVVRSGRRLVSQASPASKL
jgi:predicted phosphodiesterase